MDSPCILCGSGRSGLCGLCDLPSENQGREERKEGQKTQRVAASHTSKKKSLEKSVASQEKFSPKLGDICETPTSAKTMEHLHRGYSASGSNLI